MKKFNKLPTIEQNEITKMISLIEHCFKKTIFAKEDLEKYHWNEFLIEAKDLLNKHNKVLQKYCHKFGYTFSILDSTIKFSTCKRFLC